MHKDINVNVSGPVQPSSIYKTVVLKGQVPLAAQVTEPNTKYVIKHNFDLSSGAIVYDGWEIEGMGGNPSVIDGEEYWLTDYESGIAEPTTYNLVDDECFFVIDNHISDIKEVTLQQEENAWIATKRRGYHARILSHLDPNAAITIPENCVLEFDGGSLSNGTIVGNNTDIQAGLVKIFGSNVIISGSWTTKYAYTEWFGIDENPTNNALSFSKVFSFASPVGLMIKLANREYVLGNSIELPLHCSLVGCGNRGSVLRFVDTDGIIINNSTDVSGTIIKDICITSLNGKDAGDYVGIKMQSANYCVIRNVTVTSFNTGILLDKAVLNAFYDLYVGYCNTGIISQNESWMNRFFGGTITAIGTGLDIITSRLYLYGVDIEAFDTAFITKSAGIVYINGIHAEGENSESSIFADVRQNSQFIIRDSYVSNCTKGISSTATSGRAVVFSVEFTNIATEIDLGDFGFYHIDGVRAYTAQGGSKSIVVNVNQLTGVYNSDDYSASGYVTSIRNTVNAKKILNSGVELMPVVFHGIGTITGGLSLGAGESVLKEIIVNATLSQYSDIVLATIQSIDKNISIFAVVKKNTVNTIQLWITNNTSEAVEYTNNFGVMIAVTRT